MAQLWERTDAGMPAVFNAGCSSYASVGLRARQQQDVQRALRTPTTAGGQDVLQLLANHRFLSTIDHCHRVKGRGIWRHPTRKAWYELDFFIATSDVVSMVQSLRAQPYTFSDHLAKVACLHVRNRKVWKGLRFRADGLSFTSRSDFGRRAAERGSSQRHGSETSGLSPFCPFYLEPLLAGFAHLCRWVLPSRHMPRSADFCCWMGCLDPSQRPLLSWPSCGVGAERPFHRR